MNKVRTLTYTALLTAMAIIIPIYFGFLRVYIPPFSATIAAHVPMFIAMFFGPYAAIIVGIGSALGFLITTTPVIAARACTHIVVGFVGAVLIKKGVSFPKVVASTLPIHAILEGLVIIPFTGFNYLVAVVAIGTAVHHIVDGIIAYIIAKSISKVSKSRDNVFKSVA
ncbi:niacin transporter [Clostridium acidisoli DSM 12555]|jgi:niacin transporter|uniref:Niacin transporter n=1 Tax=Clostridium acidisoli DSM 12555 TaxID=1121291 RepID=A0A1W1XBR9_9CLOT|nr:ECF transporter S component [Clostridium acidisoli]SMC21327.1 niacin transporter [Clostridium acidisoli DSM 12555]